MTGISPYGMTFDRLGLHAVLTGAQPGSPTA